MKSNADREIMSEVTILDRCTGIWEIKSIMPLLCKPFLSYWSRTKLEVTGVYMLSYFCFSNIESRLHMALAVGGTLNPQSTKHINT